MGNFCVSIDLELAWGVWDCFSETDLVLAASADRPIVARLLKLSERYEVPMTWAIVGRMFDEAAPLDIAAGDPKAWFAPELVDAIRASDVAHDIGSHSWSHRYFDRISAQEAAEEVERDVELRRRWDLPMTSWVFPRNAIGHVATLARAGVEVYRTHDAGLMLAARQHAPALLPVTNLLDKALPVPPPLVRPATEQHGGRSITALGSSTLFLSRRGVRRSVLPAITKWRWTSALDRAAREKAMFHLWFHPSNFHYATERQFAILESAFAHASQLRNEGTLRIVTMADIAGQKELDAS